MIVFTSDDKSFDFLIAFVYALFQLTIDREVAERKSWTTGILAGS
jgi:hypothetical protein